MQRPAAVGLPVWKFLGRQILNGTAPITPTAAVCAKEKPLLQSRVFCGAVRSARVHDHVSATGCLGGARGWLRAAEVSSG